MTIQERNNFIIKNYGLILKCVSQIHLVNGCKDDMIQDAVLHVLQVVDRYDSSKGSFSTFIWPEIKQYVYRKNSGMADRAFKMACKISKTKENFKMLYGTEPSNQQLAQLIGLNPEELKKQIKKIENYNSVSLDEKNNNGDSDLYNLDFGISVNNPEEECINNTEKEAVKNSCNLLSKNERKIIELRFNLYNKNEKEFSLRKTAEVLGISHETVRALEKKALCKLKKILEEKQIAA